MSDFDRFAALSFDCYGTLIDWETGIVEASRPWAMRHGIDDDRQLLEAHATHETAVQSEHPTMRYPDVLARHVQRVADDSASTSPTRSARRSLARCRTGRRSPTRPTRSPPRKSGSG